MKFTQLFCQDKEFIKRLEHKKKYDIVLSEINKQYIDHYSEYNGKVTFFLTDNITISCSIL